MSNAFKNIFQSMSSAFGMSPVKSSSGEAVPPQAALVANVLKKKAETQGPALVQKQGRTSTKFGGLLGTSQQADTAKKTLLGQ